MTPGVFTWSELPPVSGNVLVVINSADNDTVTVEALLATMERQQPSAILHVIATPAWKPWLDTRNITAERVLITTDEDGRQIELNHFLESPAALLWIVSRQFSCITGTDAHSLYNEEVKDIFEQRVLLLLGEGRFLAHTLPNPYVYVLDLARLLERCGRDVKVREYQHRSRAIVDDLHRLWLASGSPSTADQGDYTHVLKVLEERMGAALLAFDEEGPIPLPHAPILASLAGVVSHLRDVLSEHDRRLEVMTGLHAERSEAVEVRERLLAELSAERSEAVEVRERLLAELSAERVEAVNLRDKMIEDLHLQLRKLRRLRGQS